MSEMMNREQAAAELAVMMAARLSVLPTMPRSEATRAALEGVTEKAIELILELAAHRVQLTERDREIERRVPKSAYQEMATHANEGWRLYNKANSLLSAAQAEAAELRASLQQEQDNCAYSQREWKKAEESLQAATQRAEKAEANLETQQQITRNTAKAANEARGDHFDAESALAAARKALGTAWAAMCERRGYADAWEWKYGTTWNEEDAEVSAALAPEQKGE